MVRQVFFLDITTKLLNIMDARSATEDIYFHIAQKILQYPQKIQNMGIEELADFCYTSPATISRFCRQLSLENFQQLKKQLKKTEIYRQAEVDFSTYYENNPHPKTLPHLVFSEAIHALQLTYQNIDSYAVETAAKKILHAQNIAIFGSIYSQLVAQDLQYKLLRLQKFANAYSNYEAQKKAATQLTNKDIAIFFSVSGNVPEVNHCLNLAKKNNCFCLVITHNLQSPLAKQADKLIYVGGAETPFTQSSMTGRLALMSIVDLLYLTCAFFMQHH